MVGSKEDYLAAKKCAKRAVYNAKEVAKEIRFTEINNEKDCIKDKDINLIIEVKEKLHIQKVH